jgi:formylglycine-generating enzyme required for sulfatase activity
MLALADQADLWNAKPENRRLPSLWEFMSFLRLTRKRNWPEPVRKMMRCAHYRFAKSATTTLLLGMVTAWITYEWNGSNKATSLIRALDTAATVEVPDIATEIARYDRWARPKLLRISNHPEANERHHIHANLVLLHLNVPLQFGPEIDVLFNQMLRAGPNELIVLRNALSKHRVRLTPMTWSVLESNEAIPKKQFRAACALALIDPSSPRWSRKTQFVAERLVAEISRDPANFDTWVQAFAPLKERLLSPLGEILLNETGVTRAIATQIFASYAADNSKRLAHMLPDVDEEQFIVLFPRLQSMQNRSGAIGVLHAVLAETVSPGIPEKSLEPARDRLARRQANAAVALVRLGEEEIVWPMLAQQPDPRLRSYLIHRFGPLGADLGTIIRRLDHENVTSVRRALILILGEFPEPEWTMYERKPLIAKLLDWYQYDNDPGIHAAAEWVLRQWDQDEKLRQIDTELSALGFEESRSWYINREKQTMIVFRDPPVFLMGSPRSNPTRGDDKFELQHAVQLGHSFAMSARQVTVEQFLIFASEHTPDHKPTSSDGSLDCPVNMVSWYDAARYCNWLSARHKLPQDQWCYEPNQSNEYGDGMTLTPNYLERTGFRLPSEAEWEYACRAQSITKRYYGESEELLGQYAWYLMNSHAKSLLPVGSLKPNDFGLFEMHGNLADWCQERLREDAYLAGKDGKPRWDVADTEPVRDHIARLVRGGNFMDVPSSIRSAHRTWYDPYDTLEGVGIRPTRTVISKAE